VPLHKFIMSVSKWHPVYITGLPDDEPVGEIQMAVKKMFKVVGRIKKIKIYPLVRIN